MEGAERFRGLWEDEMRCLLVSWLDPIHERKEGLAESFPTPVEHREGSLRD